MIAGERMEGPYAIDARKQDTTAETAKSKQDTHSVGAKDTKVGETDVLLTRLRSTRNPGNSQSNL